MIVQTNKSINPDNNISKTGYRALFVLMKLLKKPYSREELALECQSDPIIKKDLSKDTVTYTINTLKKAGCIISRPSVKTDNKYVLKYHPFNTLLTAEHVDALQALRESVASLGDWELLIYLNNLYAKIARIAPDNETKELLIYKHPLRGIDYKILNELMVCAKRTTEHINITYDSPENGPEELEFAPEYITFENDKLYVWGHNKKYDQIAYLRVDKVKRINTVTFTISPQKSVCEQKPLTVVEFMLKGYSAIMYTDNEHEIIIKEDKDSEYPLTIRAEVSNKSNFYQRILSFGTDCKILSPQSVKDDILAELKNIKARYQNG